MLDKNDFCQLGDYKIQLLTIQEARSFLQGAKNLQVTTIKICFIDSMRRFVWQKQLILYKYHHYCPFNFRITAYKTQNERDMFG